MPIGFVNHQRRAWPPPPVDCALKLLDKVVFDESLRDESDSGPAKPNMLGYPSSGWFFQFPFYTSEHILAVYKFQIVVLHLLHTIACPFQTQVDARFRSFAAHRGMNPLP